MSWVRLCHSLRPLALPQWQTAGRTLKMKVRLLVLLKHTKFQFYDEIQLPGDNEKLQDYSCQYVITFQTVLKIRLVR